MIWGGNEGRELLAMPALLCLWLVFGMHGLTVCCPKLAGRRRACCRVPVLTQSCLLVRVSWRVSECSCGTTMLLFCQRSAELHAAVGNHCSVLIVHRLPHCMATVRLLPSPDLRRCGAAAHAGLQ